jgi:hypothetical protein
MTKIIPGPTKVVSTASDIDIVDSGGYYTSTDVEGALIEAANSIWKTTSNLDFSLEPTTSVADGTYILPVNGRTFIFVSRGTNRDGNIQVVNGSGIKFTPNGSATTFTNCPVIYASIAGGGSILEAEYGPDAVVRCLIEIYSYAGTGTTYCFGGIYTDALSTASPRFSVASGLAGDGSPAVAAEYSGGGMNGIFTTRTELDGYKYCITDFPLGVMGGIAKVKWANSATFNLAKMGGTIYNQGIGPTKFMDSSWWTTSYGRQMPYMVIGASDGYLGGGDGTFYIKRIIIQVKRP